MSSIYLPRHVRETVERVLEATATIYGMEVRDLRSKSNRICIVRPRQVAMAALRSLGMSYPMIGKALGGKHHTTALYGVERVDRERRRNAELQAAFCLIMEAGRPAVPASTTENWGKSDV